MNYIVMQQQLLRNDRNYGSTASNEVVTPKSSNNAFLFPHRDVDTSIKDLISIAKANDCYTPLSSNNTSMTSSAWSFASLNEESQTSDSPPLTPNDCNDEQDQKRNSSNADIRLSMVSNFSAAYNTINISLALALMQAVHPPKDPSSIEQCSSALIAGMMFGQLGGGLLGDWLGRHMGLAVVMCIQIVAALMSSWSGIFFFANRDIYRVLACWRFLLGVGCGGVYPLAATMSAESSSDMGNKAKSVALMFSFQGVGYLAVSFIAMVLVNVFGEESDIAWRCLLGIGSLPGLVLIGIRIQLRRSTLRSSMHDLEAQAPLSNDTDKPQVRLPRASLLEQIKSEPNLLRKFVGTAGCWFLFDILFYGNALFQPVVLSAAFGESETIHATVRDSIIISILALPGYFVTVAMVGRQSLKRIQLQGFICMATLYFAIGMKFHELNRISLLGLYGMTFFFSNYGPNSTTFMLPSMTFSRPCRSTLNGICAASGKFGALLGSYIFLPLASQLGNENVLILCGIVSILSAILTFSYTEDVDSLEIKTKAGRTPSLAYLQELQVETFNDVPKTVSMPTFLDLNLH